jgi:hypothetical protein
MRSNGSKPKPPLGRSSLASCSLLLVRFFATPNENAIHGFCEKVARLAYGFGPLPLVARLIAYNQAMQKPVLAFAGLALIAAASCGSHGSASDSFAQKLIVAGVATTITVAPAGLNNFEIDVVFRSSTYPAGCLSAYRDLHYELRDPDNQIIPVNQQTLKNPPYEGPRDFEHVVKGSHGHSCAANAPQGVWPEFARLSALYPNLPPGKYTLHISFAPRGWAQHADFAPVPITIKPSPKPT